MALLTTHRPVDAGERKTVLQVQVGNVVYQPVGGRMATRAVRADTLLVYVAVAGNTIGRGARKNEGFMTGPAIDGVVPTL